MKFGSVCSGIEAASVAWLPLGWECAWTAEIEPFPSAVLAHHYPGVKNYGDFTKIPQDAEPIDLLVGGTPCQDFSVAGLRAGLDGARGNLTLEFARLADRLRPKWIVWENVPGVLSIDGGRAFGAFLGALGEIGYGFAYTTLDAQYFGLAQRRKRVFVVGYLGDWRRAAAVLFDAASLRGDFAPSREAGKEAPVASGGCAEIYSPLNTSWGARSPGSQAQEMDSEKGSRFVAMCLNAKGGNGRIDAESETFVTHALRAEGFDASEDGTGRGTPLTVVPILEAVAITQNGSGDVLTGDISTAMSTNQNASGRNTAKVLTQMAVRRLTPRECEALQGFPSGYTQVPFRNKPAADGPRYKAIGNSFAVPVVRWIGERIDFISKLEPSR